MRPMAINTRKLKAIARAKATMLLPRKAEKAPIFLQDGILRFLKEFQEYFETFLIFFHVHVFNVYLQHETKISKNQESSQDFKLQQITQINLVHTYFKLTHSNLNMFLSLYLR